MTPRLLPPKVAAEYIGVSPSKLRTLDLPKKRHGGNVFYDRLDLDAWADSLPYDVEEKKKGDGDEDGDGEGENTCDNLLRLRG